MNEDSSTSTTPTKIKLVRATSTGALAAVLGLGLVGTFYPAPAIAAEADGTSDRSLDMNTHFAATGMEDSDLRYAITRYAGVNSDGTITLTISKWADGLAGWGTSTTNEWAGKYILSFLNDEFYTQIDSVTLDNGTSMQKYDDGAMWTVPIQVSNGLRPGPAFVASNNSLKIKLKNGATLESLGMSDDKLGYEAVWVKGNGAIANESVSTGFVQENNPNVKNEKPTDFTAGEMTNTVVMDTSAMRINSVHAFKPNQNFLQTDYAWVVYIREQVPEELLPFIDFTGTQIYNSDLQGQYVDKNRTVYNVNLSADGKVDTSTDPALSIALDGDDLTYSKLQQVRSNINEIFWGTLGQSRYYTISYKLKDDVKLSDFSDKVRELIETKQQPLYFESSLAADYQNKYIAGGLLGKADNGADFKQLTNSYANAYLQTNDKDEDGIFDFVEFSFGYDYNSVDTDGDGVPDPQELYTDETDGTKPGQYKVSAPTTQTTRISPASDNVIAGTMPKPELPNPADPTQTIPVSNDAAGGATVKLVQADADGNPVENGTVYATATIPIADLEAGTFSIEVPAGTIPSTVSKVVLLGADPDGVNKTSGTVIDVASDADHYEPEGQDLTATPGSTAPTAKSAIANAGDLPENATYAWKDGDPDTSREGTVDATVVVTYPDGSTDEVDVKVFVASAFKDNQLYTPHGGTVDKNFGETATLDELKATLTYTPELPEGYEVKSVALKDGETIPTSGTNQRVTLTVTYADDTTDDVDVTVNYQTAAAAFEATASTVEKGFGETATLDDIRAAVTVSPNADAVSSIELVPGTTIPTTGKDNQVAVVVTYTDGTTDTLTVPVSYQTAAEKFAVSGGTLSKKPGETVTLDELKDLVTFTPELTDPSQVTSIDLAPGQTLPNGDEDKTVTLTVTFSDGSTSNVSIPVNFGPLNERFAPEGQDIKAAMGGAAPSAITAISNTQAMPAGTTYRWKDADPSTAAAGPVEATVEVVYPDGTIDEVPVTVNVEDTRPDSVKYTPAASPLTKPYGQTPTVEELAAQVSIAPAPAEGTVTGIALPDGVTIPTTGKNVSVPLVVTYADGTQDVVSVPLTYGNASDVYTPIPYTTEDGQPYETTVGVVPPASDLIANKDELPEGTTYAWGEGDPWVEAEGNPFAQVIVTYPDGSTDSVTVGLEILDKRTDAQKYPATGGSLDVAYGTAVTEADLAAKVTVADTDGNPAPTSAVTSVKLADGVTIPKDGRGLKLPMVVTYADGSTGSAEVTLGYGAANDAFDPEAEEIKAAPNAVPAASDGIKNKDDLPAGTTYAWKDGQAPSTSAPGTQTGTVVVTYPDGTTDKVEVSVTTSTYAELSEPRGQDLKVPVDGTLPDAAGAISNLTDLPTGTQVTWKDPAPDTSKPGAQDATATVTYPDGSSEEVTVTVKVGTDADAANPVGQQVSAVTGGDAPSAEDAITNKGDLPEGTKIEWVKEPDTSKPGTTSSFVKVTYPDGSSDIVEVPVKVGTDAEASDPTAKDDVKVDTGADAPAPGDVIEGDLPDGTKVEWTKEPDTSKPGDTTGTVKVTYPDGSSETVEVPVKVGDDADAADPEAKDDVKVPTGGTLPDAADTIKNPEDLPEGTTVTWKEPKPDTSTPGATEGTVVVTYPDGTSEEVTVPVKVGTDAEANTPETQVVNVAKGADAPAASTAIKNADDLPQDTEIAWVEEPDTNKVGEQSAFVKVTYPDGTSDIVKVTVKVGTDAEASDPTAKDDVKVDTGADAPAAGDVIEGDLPDGTKVEWTKEPDTSKPGATTGTVKVTYPDGSTDVVEVPVKVGTDAEANTPAFGPVSTPMGTVPAASAGVTNASELPAGTTFAWKTEPDTTNPGTVTATVVVTYPDGSTDEGEVEITVNDTRPDSVKYDAAGGELTKAYGEAATLDELKAKVTVTPEAGADAVSSIELPAGASIPTTGKDNAVTLVVKYADGTQDVVSVKLSYSDASDSFAPVAATPAVDLGTVPAASDGIANKGDLPEGTTYSWKGGSAPDTSAPGTAAGTVVVTYPDGTTDEVPVTITVNDTRTEAQKHTVTGGTLEVAYGTAVSEADLTSKVTVSPTDAVTSIALADGVTVPTNGKGLKVPVKVTFSDGSETSVEVTLSYGDANAAYTPTAQPIEALVNSVPAAADAIANLADLPAGTTVTWKGSAPDTSAAGTVNATALVTYPDGTTDEVPVTITVKTAADAFDPTAKADVTVPLNGTLPEAGTVIEGDLPAGTTVTWVEPAVDTSKPGTQTGKVTVTYPDGSTETVDVPVKVGTDADLYNPTAKDDVKVPTGGDVPAAADVIEGELPEGTTVEWTKEPDTTKPGSQTGIVKVAYPDGSSDVIEVPVKVGTDAEATDPKGQDVTVGEDGKLPDPTEAISNPGDLPDGTKVEWKDPKPDPTKPGTQTGTVVITYPDGTTEEITVTVSVPEKTDGTGGQNGQNGTGGTDGSGSQNGAGSGKGKGKGGSSRTGILPKTGDASTLAAGSLMGGGIIASAIGSILAAWKRRRRAE